MSYYTPEGKKVVVNVGSLSCNRGHRAGAATWDRKQPHSTVLVFTGAEVVKRRQWMFDLQVKCNALGRVSLMAVVLTFLVIHRLAGQSLIPNASLSLSLINMVRKFASILCRRRAQRPRTAIEHAPNFNFTYIINCWDLKTRFRWKFAKYDWLKTCCMLTVIVTSLLRLE